MEDFVKYPDQTFYVTAYITAFDHKNKRGYIVYDQMNTIKILLCYHLSILLLINMHI
jgi:hypothetical protein